ncbi:MAG: UvrB/UvrC motif-containing protein [Candidatus Omnitrophica bacterium]|nr:UvrB/UvrC motif-containing protein [Candidatus Omnitrophota bacterium]
MVCDICGNMDATVHLTEIVNDQMTKLHLCEECAKKKGAEMEEHFGLADLLAGLADVGTPLQVSDEKKLKCDSCGLTYSDFKKIGRLGCGQCYDKFRSYLVPLFKRIHGSDVHLGKVPHQKTKTPKQNKVNTEDLKRRLKRAVELEEFEEAVKLRDEIKKYERK